MSVETGPEAPAEDAASRGRLIAGWSPAAAVVALALLAWWVLTPSVFGPSGNLVSGTTEVGTTECFGTGIYADAGEQPETTMSSVANAPPADVGPTPEPNPVVTIDIVEPTPVITTNTSGAAVEILHCIHRGAGAGIGAGSASLMRQSCSSVTPFSPDSFTVDEHNSLLLAVTPQTPGRIRIEGLRIDYRDDLRRGSQQAGICDEVNS